MERLDFCWLRNSVKYSLLLAFRFHFDWLMQSILSIAPLHLGVWRHKYWFIESDTWMGIRRNFKTNVHFLGHRIVCSVELYAHHAVVKIEVFEKLLISLGWKFQTGRLNIEFSWYSFPFVELIFDLQIKYWCDTYCCAWKCGALEFRATTWFSTWKVVRVTFSVQSSLNRFLITLKCIEHMSYKSISERQFFHAISCLTAWRATSKIRLKFMLTREIQKRSMHEVHVLFSLSFSLLRTNLHK